MSSASAVVYRFFPGKPISTKSGITGITPFFALILQLYFAELP